MTQDIKKNILIVEDERKVAYTFSRALEKQGYNVICADNGEIGLRLLHNASINLTILDIQMPIMDGIEFMKVIIRSPEYKNLPVLVKSGVLYEYKTILSKIYPT